MLHTDTVCHLYCQFQVTKVQELFFSLHISSYAHKKSSVEVVGQFSRGTKLKVRDIQRCCTDLQ